LLFPPFVLVHGIAQERDGLKNVDPVRGVVHDAALDQLDDLALGEAVRAPPRVNVRLLALLNLLPNLVRTVRVVEGRQSREDRVQVVSEAKNVNFLVERVIKVLFGCSPLRTSNHGDIRTRRLR
jgi:hypothetical protein